MSRRPGSRRGTFRSTVCKPGSGDAPSVAYGYPFAETAESWIPQGMDRATAYAYLSAAADFTVSQVVDRTGGLHDQIYKNQFS